MNKITTQNLEQFLGHPSTVGFDRMISMLDSFGRGQDTSYPPYNVYQKDENQFVIELALAGFTVDDISITQHENKLLIEGNTQVDNETDNRVYLHKGISSRKFKREFVLADHVNVNSADMTNGILLIDLEREVPDEQKPRKIKISS